MNPEIKKKKKIKKKTKKTQKKKKKKRPTECFNYLIIIEDYNCAYKYLNCQYFFKGFVSFFFWN